ncbi:MAG: CBS domain-containing protein [Candidatus Omnitrophica bacterium]|nr:CBS domain-containing protein [Candidatus Omnitrophota bacterium]
MRIVPFLKRLLSSVPAEDTAEDTWRKTARVSEVYRIHGMASAVLPEDSPLESIIIKFAGEPSLRGMFLTDAQGHFSGVVTRIDLLRWVHLKLFGGKGRHEIAVSEFYRIVDARKGKDIAHSASNMISVRETDSLQSGLDKMLDHEEEVLPVLNSRGEIVGDLRLSEVLSWALTKSRDIYGNPKTTHT